MNNIYKVIWSKAKNCYVVASEIARSHTKSASGSEKIGGVARHALLALGVACAIACGGFVNVGAAVQCETISPTGTTSNPVLTASNLDDDAHLNTVISVVREDKLVTKDNIAGQLTDYAKASDLSAKADANDVYSKTDAENTFATKTELGSYATRTELDAKANTDLSNLTADGETKIKNIMSADMEKKANKDTVTALGERVGGVEGKVANLETQTGNLSTDGKSLTGMDAVSGTTVSGDTVNAGSLNVTGEISNGNGVTTTLEKINASMEKTNQNADKVADLEKKTSKIDYDAANDKTTINGVGISNTQVDMGGKDITNARALTATGKVTGDGVDAGTGAITGGSLTVTGKVTGNGVDAGAGAITGGSLSVTGDTSLGNTTVDGNLKVTGTITTDNMVFGDKATNNYTEIDHGKVTSTNLEVRAGQAISSSSTFDVEKNEVGFGNGITDEQSSHKQTSDVITDTVKNNNTGDQSFHKQTSDVIMDNVRDGKNSNNRTQTKTETKDIITDENGNSSTTSQTANENKTYLTDKDRKNTNSTIDTAKGYDKTIKGENGKTSTKQDELNITNTAQNGTITNDAQNIVNKANTMDTNVTGQATESYGKLDTTVNGAENHTVNGQQTNTVGGGQINNITGGQKNNILIGNQETTVSNGSIINKAENGDISNTAKNVTNVGTESVTNKVGTNEVKVSQGGVDIKVGADTSRTMTDGRIIDKAGDMTVTTDKTTGTTFENGTPKDTTVINGGTIGTNKVNANETNTKKLTAGADDGADGGRLTVDADGVKGSYKSGDYTSRSYILANTLMSGVDNGKDITDNGFVGSRTDHYMDGDKAKLNETVKDADGSNVTKKTSTKTYTEIKDTNGNTLSVNQKADGNNYKLEDQDGNTNHVTNSATQSKQTLKDKDGNTLTTNQTATKNNFDLKSADGSKENHTTNTVDESRVAIKGENGKAELSTTDEGTTFKHSAAKEAFTEGGATNTTIKGNTITTGKVTMDYADVMKDLGVYGNTTLGEAGKDTTLTVNSKATFNEIATFENGAEVKNGLTVSSGGLNVTGESTFNDKVTMKNGLDVTGGVASDSFTVKGTDIKIDSSGINAGGTVISNVADGSISEGSKDAVNGGQLYQVKNDLEGKVNKVGANAAAMANLHPMEFDPDSKWNIAAAIGNYGSETAAALGAFYRPNDDVMVNLSTAFGTGENMVGGGVSVRLGKGGNKLSREENNALKDQVNDLTARMDALLSVLNPNMSKDFPDVPENHWAYEAVSRLAGNDIVQGYPDGEFHGERTMTRYEMAEIIYNALSRGAEAEKELVEEFKPELQAMAASEKATAERAEG